LGGKKPLGNQEQGVKKGKKKKKKKQEGDKLRRCAPGIVKQPLSARKKSSLSAKPKKLGQKPPVEAEKSAAK